MFFCRQFASIPAAVPVFEFLSPLKCKQNKRFFVLLFFDFCRQLAPALPIFVANSKQCNLQKQIANRAKLSKK
jgi:hypothetical protein